MFDHMHHQHVGPLLAHFRAFDPWQPGYRRLRIRQAHGEKPALRVRHQRCLQLVIVDALQIADHAQRAQRPTLGTGPALDDRHHRQDHQRQRQQPRDESQEGIHRPPTSAIVVSRISQHSVSKSMPIWRAAFGTSE